MSDIIYKQSRSKSKVYCLLRSIHKRPASDFYKSTCLPSLQWKKAMAIICVYSVDLSIRLEFSLENDFHRKYENV